MANVVSGPRLQPGAASEQVKCFDSISYISQGGTKTGRDGSVLQCYMLHNSGYLLCILYTIRSRPRDSYRKNISNNAL